MSQWTNENILKAYGGLVALSARTLPTITSDLKVSGLLRTRFVTAQGVVEDARKKIQDLSEKERDAQWQVLLRQTQEITDVPSSLRLTRDDLPQTLKSKDGEENRRGVADIIVALGDLFVDKPVDNSVDNG